MQIILTQSEIEDALRQSILQQISLRDGQDITFDFKSTRGDDGLTATIQISAPVQQVGTKLETKADKVTAEKATPRNISTEPEDRQEPEALKESEKETKAAPEPADEDKPAENKASAKVETTIFPNEGTSAPLTEPEVAPEVAAKSLFANLQKPVNGAK